MESSNSTALLLESFRSRRLNDLTKINLDDLVSSFGWEGRPLLAGMLRALFILPARKFARQMLDFDDAVGQFGLVDGARQAQRLYVRSLRIFSGSLPAGPFLALSNHPGMVDTLALFSALHRNDLKIIAVDRPFLKSLTNVSQRLFYVTDDPGARMSLVRQVSGHLRSGGAILTFPAGKIEPDANVYPGAVEALQGWTDSVGIFIRMAPETAILPVVVRGVIWDKAARYPLTRLKKTRDEREKLAAAFQLLTHIVLNKKPLDVTVQIGKPITAAELGRKDTQAIHQAVLAEMKRLIEHPPKGEGVSVL
jgi:1-acyl-sn-glycerol-3-phosphate acyltransferase